MFTLHFTASAAGGGHGWGGGLLTTFHGLPSLYCTSVLQDIDVDDMIGPPVETGHHHSPVETGHYYCSHERDVDCQSKFAGSTGDYRQKSAGRPLVGRAPSQSGTACMWRFRQKY